MFAPDRDITLSHSFAIGGRTVQFFDDDEIVFRSGNSIVFLRMSRREQIALQLQPGESLDCFAVLPRYRLIAVALHGANQVQIRLYRHPTHQRALLHSLNYSSVFPLSHIAVSRCGTRISAVGSAFSRKLLIWDISSLHLDSLSTSESTSTTAMPTNPESLQLEATGASSSGSTSDFNNVSISSSTSPAPSSLSSSLLPAEIALDNGLIIDSLSFNPRDKEEILMMTSTQLIVWRRLTRFGTVQIIRVDIQARSPMLTFLHPQHLTASTSSSSSSSTSAPLLSASSTGTAQPQPTGNSIFDSSSSGSSSSSTASSASSSSLSSSQSNHPERGQSSHPQRRFSCSCWLPFAPSLVVLGTQRGELIVTTVDTLNAMTANQGTSGSNNNSNNNIKLLGYSQGQGVTFKGLNVPENKLSSLSSSSSSSTTTTTLSSTLAHSKSSLDGGNSHASTAIIGSQRQGGIGNKKAQSSPLSQARYLDIETNPHHGQSHDVQSSALQTINSGSGSMSGDQGQQQPQQQQQQQPDLEAVAEAALSLLSTKDTVHCPGQGLLLPIRLHDAVTALAPGPKHLVIGCVDGTVTWLSYDDIQKAIDTIQESHSILGRRGDKDSSNKNTTVLSSSSHQGSANVKHNSMTNHKSSSSPSLTSSSSSPSLPIHHTRSHSRGHSLHLTSSQFGSSSTIHKHAVLSPPSLRPALTKSMTHAALSCITFTPAYRVFVCLDTLGTLVVGNIDEERSDNNININNNNRIGTVNEDDDSQSHSSNINTNSTSQHHSHHHRHQSSAHAPQLRVNAFVLMRLLPTTLPSPPFLARATTPMIGGPLLAPSSSSSPSPSASASSLIYTSPSDYANNHDGHTFSIANMGTVTERRNRMTTQQQQQQNVGSSSKTLVPSRGKGSTSIPSIASSSSSSSSSSPLSPSLTGPVSEQLWRYGMGLTPLTQSLITLGAYPILACIHVGPLPPVADALPGMSPSPTMQTYSHELRLVHTRTKSVIATVSFPIGDAPLQLTASPDGHMLAVGFASGAVRVLDVTDPAIPRCIFSERLHEGPVGALLFAPAGPYLASLSFATEQLVILRYATVIDSTLTSPLPASSSSSSSSSTSSPSMPSPSDRDRLADAEVGIGLGLTIRFELAGTTPVLPSPTCMQWIPIDQEHKLFIGNALGFVLILSAPSTLFVDSQGRTRHRLPPLLDTTLFPPSIINPTVCDVKVAPLAIAPDPQRNRHFFVLSADKLLRRFVLSDPSDPFSEASGITGPGVTLGPSGPICAEAGARWDDEFAGHLKPGAVLTISPNGDLIASAARDGLIIVRRSRDLLFTSVCTAHDPAVGGVQSLAFSANSSLLYSTGRDGGILCWSVAPLLPPLSSREPLPKLAPVAVFLQRSWRSHGPGSKGRGRRGGRGDDDGSDEGGDDLNNGDDNDLGDDGDDEDGDDDDDEDIDMLEDDVPANDHDDENDGSGGSAGGDGGLRSGLNGSISGGHRTNGSPNQTNGGLRVIRHRANVAAVSLLTQLVAETREPEDEFEALIKIVCALPPALQATPLVKDMSACLPIAPKHKKKNGNGKGAGQSGHKSNEGGYDNDGEDGEGSMSERGGVDTMNSTSKNTNNTLPFVSKLPSSVTTQHHFAPPASNTTNSNTNTNTSSSSTSTSSTSALGHNNYDTNTTNSNNNNNNGGGSSGSSSNSSQGRVGSAGIKGMLYTEKYRRRPKHDILRSTNQLDENDSEMMASGSMDDPEHEVASQLQTLRRRLNSLYESNDRLAQEHRLGVEDFVLDTDALVKMKGEITTASERTRKQINRRNQGRSLISWNIRRQCWDGMITHGLTVRALLPSADISNGKATTTYEVAMFGIPRDDVDWATCAARIPQALYESMDGGGPSRSKSIINSGSGNKGSTANPLTFANFTLSRLSQPVTLYDSNGNRVVHDIVSSSFSGIAASPPFPHYKSYIDSNAPSEHRSSPVNPDRLPSLTQRESFKRVSYLTRMGALERIWYHQRVARVKGGLDDPEEDPMSGHLPFERVNGTVGAEYLLHNGKTWVKSLVISNVLKPGNADMSTSEVGAIASHKSILTSSDPSAINSSGSLSSTTSTSGGSGNSNSSSADAIINTSSSSSVSSAESTSSLAVPAYNPTPSSSTSSSPSVPSSSSSASSSSSSSSTTSSALPSSSTPLGNSSLPPSVAATVNGMLSSSISPPDESELSPLLLHDLFRALLAWDDKSLRLAMYPLAVCCTRMRKVMMVMYLLYLVRERKVKFNERISSLLKQKKETIEITRHKLIKISELQQDIREHKEREVLIAMTLASQQAMAQQNAEAASAAALENKLKSLGINTANSPALVHPKASNASSTTATTNANGNSGLSLSIATTPSASLLPAASPTSSSTGGLLSIPSLVSSSSLSNSTGSVGGQTGLTADMFTLHEDEDPDRVLTVHDSEITSPPPVTAEVEAARRKAANDAKTAALASEGLTRGLYDMMYGVLEGKKGAGTAGLVIQRPDWMFLSPETWTDEQRAQAIDIERKERVARAEREARARTMETDLKKLRTEVLDTCRVFDSQVRQAALDRVVVARACYRDEIIALGLVKDIEVEAHAEGTVIKAKGLVDKLASERTKKLKSLSQFRREIIELSSQLEKLKITDRSTDKAAKSIFTELQTSIAQSHGQSYASGLADLFFKLYKMGPVALSSVGVRRTSLASDGSMIDPITGHPINSGERRSSMSGSQSPTRRQSLTMPVVDGGSATTQLTPSPSTALSPVGGYGSIDGGMKDSSSNTADPFDVPLPDRSASSLPHPHPHPPHHPSKGNHVLSPTSSSSVTTSVNSINASSTPSTVLSRLTLLDRPTDIDVSIWSKVVSMRDGKVQRETDIGRMTNDLVALQRHVTALEQTCSSLAAHHTALNNALRTSSSALQRLRLDTRLAVVVKQGLVELSEEYSPLAPDLDDALLIPIDIILSENTKIRAAGAKNAGLLRGIGRMRADVELAQWALKKQQLLLAQAEASSQDVQIMRTTKALQESIKAGGQDSRHAAVVSMLQRKEDHIKSLAEEEIAVRMHALHRVQRKTQDMVMENARLSRAVQRLEELVGEREQVLGLRPEETSSAEAMRKEALNRIAQRRKVIGYIAQQHLEIAAYREEYERLKSRTFPSFLLPALPAPPSAAVEAGGASASDIPGTLPHAPRVVPNAVMYAVNELKASQSAANLFPTQHQHQQHQQQQRQGHTLLASSSSNSLTQARHSGQIFALGGGAILQTSKSSRSLASSLSGKQLLPSPSSSSLMPSMGPNPTSTGHPSNSRNPQSGLGSSVSSAALLRGIAKGQSFSQTKAMAASASTPSLTLPPINKRSSGGLDLSIAGTTVTSGKSPSSEP